MPRLTRLLAREVLDSRAHPTVEVEAFADGGACGVAIVPAGASTGRYEARELRDGDETRYGGLGVRMAVRHVLERIAPALIGLEIDDQQAIDGELLRLDGTPDKSGLGANAVLGVSLAVARTAATARGEQPWVHLNRLWRRTLDHDAPRIWTEPTLPLPMVNMISGGLHAGGNLDFQDFLMIPVGARSFGHALEMAAGVYLELGRLLLAEDGESPLVGDEGGYGPRLRSGMHAVERILQSARNCGLRTGEDAAVALDVAAGHFYDPESGTYRLIREGQTLDATGLIEKLADWVRESPIVSIEDGLDEDDWDGWTRLTSLLGDRVQLIGDDLFATQADRLRQGIDRGAANAVLIKPNQVGTLTETLEAMALARCNGYRTIVSARSGETEDTTIADLAVATAAGQIKIGSVARSERLAKYNRLLRIEEALGGPDVAPFAGRTALGF